MLTLKFIQENNIDILHNHWYKNDLLGLLAVRDRKCRIVTTPHGWSKIVTDLEGTDRRLATETELIALFEHFIFILIIMMIF